MVDLAGASGVSQEPNRAPWPPASPTSPSAPRRDRPRGCRSSAVPCPCLRAEQVAATCRGSGDLRALCLGWLLSAQSGDPDDDDLEPPGQSVRRPLRHLVAYGSTNKYRPVNRSRASGSSAKRPTQTASSSFAKATMLTMTANVKAMDSERWVCRTHSFQFNGTSSEDEPEADRRSETLAIEFPVHVVLPRQHDGSRSMNVTAAPALSFVTSATFRPSAP